MARWKNDDLERSHRKTILLHDSDANSAGGYGSLAMERGFVMLGKVHKRSMANYQLLYGRHETLLSISYDFVDSTMVRLCDGNHREYFNNLRRNYLGDNVVI